MMQNLTVDQRIRQAALRMSVETAVASGEVGVTDQSLIETAERFANYIRTGETK